MYQSYSLDFCHWLSSLLDKIWQHERAPKTNLKTKVKSKIFHHCPRQRNILKAKDKIAFPFLRLPTELQCEIVNCAWQYSNLKALRLVSKHVSDIATPYLYYEVDLTRANICSTKKKIDILLIQPANLRLVRILKTSRMTPEDSLLMDQLLPQLRKDFLKEINFVSASVEKFPTPKQIEFLWCHQKNLQNLELKLHMIPWLDKFSKELKPSQSDILKFFSNLEISNKLSEWNRPSTQKGLLWPLQNLDLSVLRKLTFSAPRFDDSIFSTLNAKIARGYFVNLTELGFQNIHRFDQTLILTKMPSLKSLVINCCALEEPNLPIVLVDDIRLSSLTYRHMSGADIEKFIPLLTQAIGLEYLSITREFKVLIISKSQLDLVLAAIIVHKDTLRGLHLNGILALKTDLDARLYDSVLIEAIQTHCKDVVNLSIPFVSKKPVSYYCNFAASFPHMEILTIYESAVNNHYSIRSRKDALKLFSASTSLKYIYLKRWIDDEGRRFVRKELAEL